MGIYMEKHQDKYRSEIKYIFNPLDYNSIKKDILINGFSFKHKSNTINNIYFDFNNESFNDNIDGNLIRAKIRLRWYNKFQGHVFLEEKIKKGSAGKKNIFKLNINSTDNYNELVSILEKTTGHKKLKPIIRNMYFREYFEKSNVRLTLDSRIKYSDFEENFIFFEKINILEMKFDNKIESIKFDYLPSKMISKYSKYQNAIEKLKLDIRC